MSPHVEDGTAGDGPAWPIVRDGRGQSEELPDEPESLDDDPESLLEDPLSLLEDPESLVDDPESLHEPGSDQDPWSWW